MVLVIIPTLMLFLLLQRFIYNGFTSGAIEMKERFVSTYHPLHDGWTLTGGEQVGVPATVPGCVHTDLLAAGLIEDPYLDDNELRQGWIGRTDWGYRTTFDRPAAGQDRVDLVCDGLDTVATLTAQRGRGGTARRTCTAATASTSPRCCTPATTPSRSASPPPYTYAEAHRDALGAGPARTPSRSSSSARWPATSAGTGARPW